MLLITLNSSFFHWSCYKQCHSKTQGNLVGEIGELLRGTILFLRYNSGVKTKTFLLIHCLKISSTTKIRPSAFILRIIFADRAEHFARNDGQYGKAGRALLSGDWLQSMRKQYASWIQSILLPHSDP